MRRTKRYQYELAQGIGAGSPNSASWLWYDSFDTADAAPIASTVAANPGPGTSSYTGSTGALSGGAYVEDSATTAGIHNAAGGTPRTGLACVAYGVTYSRNTSINFGFTSAAGFGVSSGRPLIANTGGALTQIDGSTAMTVLGTTPLVTGVELDLLVLADTIGGFGFYRLAGAATWTLLAVTRLDTSATIYPRFGWSNAAGSCKAMGLAAGVAMPAKYNFAASGVQGVMTLPTADFFAAMRLTSTATNGLKFRLDGSGNYFLAQRTNAGQLNLTRYDATSPTSIVNNAMTAAANDRIYLRMVGNVERLAGHPTGGTWVNGTTQTITQHSTNLGVEVLDESAYDSLEIYPLTGHVLGLPRAVA